MSLVHKPQINYQDISPVKMKRGYQEAVYFRVILTTNPRTEDKRFNALLNDLIEYDGLIPGDIRLTSIPETSGTLGNSEYNVDFIYYRGR